MTHSADRCLKISCTLSPHPPLPPPPPAAPLRMRNPAPGVLFRPVPRPLGHFRLFVLLIVDLTRIQPNIQRTVLLPNRLVRLTTLPLLMFRPRRVFDRCTVPVRAPSSSFFACLFPLGATGHAIRVVLCVYVVVYGGAGPCSCTPGMGFFFKGETCFVKTALKLAGSAHTASRAGDEAVAAASLPVSSCLNAVVPLSQTPILLSH